MRMTKETLCRRTLSPQDSKNYTGFEAETNVFAETTPDTPLVEAARVLAERKMGCLPVVKEGRLVGILTEGDFVAMVARKQSS
jgi:CBS domain-containing protein